MKIIAPPRSFWRAFRSYSIFGMSLFAVLVLASAPCAFAENGKRQTVEQACPDLALSALAYATLENLPEGTLLRAGTLEITSQTLRAEIQKTDDSMRPQMEKSPFYLLEQMAARVLLLREAAASDAATSPALASARGESALMQKYFQSLLSGVEVSDAEIESFYKENKEMCGGVPFENAKKQLRSMVLEDKKQKVANEHIRTLGKRIPIAVQAAWTRAQAEAARDNPVDKARASGQPALVDFGAKGCKPCDMLAPILDTLRTKYEGRAGVIFVNVRNEPVLAERYGIQVIPVQIFFDKSGKEVFRHTGFYPQAEIEKKMAELGIR